MLNSLLQQFSIILKTSSKIYCDSNKEQCNIPSQLLTIQRPDIAVLDGDKMAVIELTIGFETNTLISREHKIKRYNDLKSQLLQPVSKFKMLFLEITSVEFISKQLYKPFSKYLKSVGVNSDSWTDPELNYV